MHPHEVFMKNIFKQKPLPRPMKLSVRLAPEHYSLVEQAANREGLQLSSFITMLLVRVHILPESCLKQIKRRPIPLFRELHSLLGTLNLIGGNCKQLASALPDTAGLRTTHASLIRAADAVTDALQGKPVPVNTNVYRLEGQLTAIGYSFNDIVRSVNMGRPQLIDLPEVLSSLTRSADTITATITGRPVGNPDMAYVRGLSVRAVSNVKAEMKKAAAKHTKPHKGKR